MFTNYKYDLSFIKIMAKKFAVIFIAIIFTLLLSKLITNNNIFLSKIGRNSMAIYVLHLPVHYLLEYVYKNPIFYNSLNVFIFSFILTMILVVILSRNPVTKYFNIFINSVYDVLVRILLKNRT